MGRRRLVQRRARGRLWPCHKGKEEADLVRKSGGAVEAVSEKLE